jgi:prophage regulatory protein
MPGPRIYRFPDLRPAGVIFSRMHVDRLERRGQFPKRFRYGANSVAWVADEVDQWVEGRIQARQTPNGSGGDVAAFNGYVSWACPAGSRTTRG